MNVMAYEQRLDFVFQRIGGGVSLVRRSVHIIVVIW
jgi:hypothetical protein